MPGVNTWMALQNMQNTDSVGCTSTLGAGEIGIAILMAIVILGILTLLLK